MMVEIPDPEVILSGVVAFLVGVFGLFFYYKLKPYVNLRQKSPNPAYLERLEYYERQLIDMKIRLDAMEMDGSASGAGQAGAEFREAVREGTGVEGPLPEPARTEPKKGPILRDFGHSDITDYVLRLITDKSLTSRDIQITIGRTREHTSRLMKKLYNEGLVERHTGSKPYTYSITKKGREKLGLIEPVQSVV